MKILVWIALSMSLLMAESFTLKSSDLAGQFTKAQEFNGFGCNGQNISPELSWSGAPKGTKSFAVTIYDPDAPTGSGWWHWQIVNIPAKVTSIQTDASAKHTLPKGALEIVNDYGTLGFGGACPPVGDKAHTYIVTVYALDVETLPVEAKTNGPIVGYQMNAHTLAKASLIAYYGRD
ncbi:MAG TPA: YbhB/YbcL family Raf kinase inhibitor-like protein [Epsilonproteobacteria bacterium]|nr:YbhB/YbcL family Raf kinase inhibitor-like protein [Campylobacterota bacterium]